MLDYKGIRTWTSLFYDMIYIETTDFTLSQFFFALLYYF